MAAITCGVGCDEMSRVLIACEESQAVTIAFRNLGHEAFSCDLQECSGGHPEWHHQGDVFEYMANSEPFDLMIGHPPCTYISYAGTSSWNNPGRIWKRLKALEFFARLWEVDIPRICLENPKSCASPVIAKYSQVIQPYYFGDSFMKTTWLWLKNLEPLKHSPVDTLFEEATHIEKPEPYYIAESGKAVHWCDTFGGGGNGAKNRSKTFPGIANAMAIQWGGLLNTTNEQTTY